VERVDEHDCTSTVCRRHQQTICQRIHAFLNLLKKLWSSVLKFTENKKVNELSKVAQRMHEDRAPPGWKTNRAWSDYAKYIHLEDILVYIGKNMKGRQSLQPYDDNELHDFFARNGILGYGIDAMYIPNITYYQSILLNCVFDRVDCSRVHANVVFRPDLGELCMSFGKPVSN
jgi:hypothetical protein